MLGSCNFGSGVDHAASLKLATFLEGLRIATSHADGCSNTRSVCPMDRKPRVCCDGQLAALSSGTGSRAVVKCLSCLLKCLGETGGEKRLTDRVGP